MNSRCFPRRRAHQARQRAAVNSQSEGLHDSPGYQAAFAALGSSAERGQRIIEGVDG